MSLVLLSSLVTILAFFLVQLRYDGFYFILYSFVPFCCYLLEACTFLTRVNNGWERKCVCGKLGGVEGGGNCILMKKKNQKLYIFSMHRNRINESPFLHHPYIYFFNELFHVLFF